jgi:multiple antibiotic resistance protein
MNELSLFIGAFTSLFSIVNPINATPIFITITESDTNERRYQIAKKASIYMFFILTAFFLAGSYILTFFGISIPGIRIAGGIMLANSAFNMLSTDKKGRKLSRDDVHEAIEKEDVSFTPLAMPMLSGPGSIATVITWAAETNSAGQYAAMLSAILVVCAVSYGILRISPAAIKLLGKTGLGVMTRIMGFIVLCVAVQFIINGVIPILRG